MTGGEADSVALASVESFNIATRRWVPLTSLPYTLVAQAQSDLGRPTVLGGRLVGMPIPMVLEYVGSQWRPTNYWLPANLAGHSITAYPRDLASC